MPIINKLSYPNILENDTQPQEIAAHLKRGGAAPLGQYAYAWEDDGDVQLLRDPIGSNKLFFGVDQDGVTVIASRILDLVCEGLNLDDIGSCPPGHLVRLDGASVIENVGFDLATIKAASDFNLSNFHQQTRARLDNFFSTIAERYGDDPFIVCLSGGLDSSTIAFFAQKYLANVKVATFSYLSPEEWTDWEKNRDLTRITGVSEDFASAKSIADALDLQMIPIFRCKHEVVPMIYEAVRLCQDWRDFNVHCAIVNLFIAQDLSHRFRENGGAYSNG